MTMTRTHTTTRIPRMRKRVVGARRMSFATERFQSLWIETETGQPGID
jgi:hypothetical protein